MKPLILPLFVVSAMWAVFSTQCVLADGPASSCSAAAGSSEVQGPHDGHWKEAFAQLDLTDAQKEQIKQIRSTVTDHKERRQQIMAVLTPEQKEKLKRLIEQYRENRGSSASST